MRFVRALESRVMLEPLALDCGKVCGEVAPVVARVHLKRGAPLRWTRRERFYGVRASPYARAARASDRRRRTSAHARTHAQGECSKVSSIVSRRRKGSARRVRVEAH